MGNTHTAPQAEDTILTSASETDSEAIVAFNFGGSTGIILILVMALVLSFSCISPVGVVCLDDAENNEDQLMIIKQ